MTTAEVIERFDDAVNALERIADTLEQILNVLRARADPWGKTP